jgi:hypothetical protein
MTSSWAITCLSTEWIFSVLKIVSVSIINPWWLRQRQPPKIEIHSVLNVDFNIHFLVSNFQFSDNWVCFKHRVRHQKGSVSHLPEWEVSCTPPPFMNYKTRVFINHIYVSVKDQILVKPGIYASNLGFTKTVLVKAWNKNYLHLILGFYQLVLENVRISHKNVVKAGNFDLSWMCMSQHVQGTSKV